MNELKKSEQIYPLSIAPMMDWTDRHYRYFMRQITKHTILYTEMINSNAILHGDRNYHLDFSEIEKPLVLQIGGDNPEMLSECAKIAEQWGYDEVNLNIGCPSDRVQNGNFGACLMAQPELVADCVEKMQNSVSIPITVKHRIGIDNLESYENLYNFVKIVSEAGCKRFIVHARIAILKGLSPKENRIIPPLRYDDVYKLKKDFPNLIIEINGGIKDLKSVSENLKLVDGVMIGRTAYEDPFIFSLADSIFFNDNKYIPTRRKVIEAMIPYIFECNKKGIGIHRIVHHMLGLFNSKQGSKIWKRYISENAHKKDKSGEILEEVIKILPKNVLDEKESVSNLFTAI